MNVRRRPTWQSLPLLASLLVAVPAFAQQGEIAPEEVKKHALALAAQQAAAAARPQGWKLELAVGATGSLLHSSSVLGQDDGRTTVLGLLLTGAAGLNAGQHEWQNTLKIEESQTSTPLLDTFVKSADNFELKTVYLYHLLSPPWLGPYARGRVNTSLFTGYLLRPDAVTVLRKDRQGDVSPLALDPQERWDVTAPFEPLQVVESVGAFAQPLSSDTLKVDFKLGVGGQHFFVGDGYAVTDDGATPELELTQLESSQSVGGEAEVALTGKVATNVTWGVVANVFYPFVTSLDTELEGLERTHTDLGANVSVKLAKWLSLDYVLKARRLPFVLDEWQVQNSLLLTAGFNLL